jgi:hypothetical protein
MRLQVLALDYDGTIAIDGILDPAVRAVLGEAREQGIAVLLVTGRILADLERLLDDLRIFDAIVAENGAMVHFPESRRSILLAPPPPPAFLDELRHREIPFLAGESVVEIDAAHDAEVLAVVRDTQLPLVLLFNRGRMMVLPQATSKATGLREALRALRLSAHNAIGIGDAENDHQLLAFCELGAAVAWGSPALKASADEILPGDGPSAVADYIRHLLREPRIDPERLGRRRIHLGVREGGAAFALAMRDHNLLIAGDTQSGKVAGILCEQLMLEHYYVCVIDPEGAYGALETLPSVVVLDTEPHAPDLADVERTLCYPDVSAVFDLSAMDLERKRGYVRQLLERLRDLRRRTGLPHAIVIDEAHYFLHDRSVAELLDLDLGGYALVTCHASQLDPQLLSASEAIIATSISDPEEARVLHALRGQSYELGAWSKLLRELESGHAALLPGTRDSGGDMVRFRVSGRLTAPVPHRQKYLNRAAPGGRSFVFRGGGVEGREARSLGELLAVLSEAPDLSAHLRRKDLSRWIRDVFDDRLLANRLQVLEECWAAGRLEQPHVALSAAIRGRYGDDESPASPPGA